MTEKRDPCGWPDCGGPVFDIDDNPVCCPDEPRAIAGPSLLRPAITLKAQPIKEDEIMDEEMMAALEKDGEMLRQLTGEDHGPYFLPEPDEAVTKATQPAASRARPRQ